MKPSWKHKEERQFFDVHAHSNTGKWRKLFRWFGNRQTVNLRPSFARRNRYFVVVASGLFIVGIFVGNRVLTRAEALDLYPATCLGTWQNVGFAAGAPENFNSAEAIAGFSDENSAIYRLPESEIYCGGFLSPDAETKGTLTSVALTLVWHAGEPEERVIEMAGGVSSTVEEASTEPTASSSQISPSEILEDKPDESASSTGTNDAQSRGPESSVFSFVFGRAHAQDVDPAPPPAEPASLPEEVSAPPAPAEPAPPAAEAPAPAEAQPSAPAPSTSAAEPEPPAEPSENSSTPVIILPSLTAELEMQVSSTEPNILSEASSSDDATAPEVTTSLPVAPPPPPDEDFLIVSYSLDGMHWAELQRVNPDNWQNFTVALPIVSWAELQQLQISVKGIPTTLDPVPQVYLAGMFVEAKYDVAPLFGNEEEVVDESTAGLPIIELGPDQKPMPADGREEGWSGNEAPVFDLDLKGLSGEPRPITDGGATTSSAPTIADKAPAPPPIEDPAPTIPENEALPPSAPPVIEESVQNTSSLPEEEPPVVPAPEGSTLADPPAQDTPSASP